MSDDLIKRLHNVRLEGLQELCWEAADRMGQLTEERDITRRLLSAATQMQKETQANLAKAVEALWEIADFSKADPVKYIKGVDAIALDALAELEGK